MINLQLSTKIYSHCTRHLHEMSAWFYVASGFLEDDNGYIDDRGKYRDQYSIYWIVSDPEEVRQLQLAQVVLATVPLDEINSNNWGAILEERGIA